jgi:hypothetical protein
MNHLLYALVLLLAFSLPFEIIHPLLVLPWFQFTNLELLVVATMIIWIGGGLLYLARSWRTLPVWFRDGTAESRLRTAGKEPLVWLPLLFLVLATLSAILAPMYRLEALKFVTRIAFGLYIFGLTLYTVRTPSQTIGLLWALILGSGISGLLGLGEAAGWSPVDPLLALFKEAPTRVGGELRVSASFQYATIAAMFFEMTVPLALALAATAQIRTHRWLALAIAFLGTANIVLTFTRAGMVTITVVMMIMLVFAWRQPRFRQLASPALLSLGVLIATAGILTLQTTTFRTRLLTENDLNWYGASYTAPASLHLMADKPTRVTVTVQNTGRVQWHTNGENPFALGYYWLTDDQQVVQEGHVEVPLPHSVAPGETTDVDVVLHPALPPGDYQLVWGMLQHNILWFRHRDVPEMHTAVHIEQAAAISAPVESAQAVPGGEAPSLPPTVARLDLWRAALRMWAERPLLGVGPDNFRHLYGRYLGISEWDKRLHANNLYLELLANLGLAGTLVFAALSAAIASRWLYRWRAATGTFAILLLGLAGAFLAFFVHGFLDYFLEFVSLYLLFWIVAALIVATGRISANVDNHL